MTMMNVEEEATSDLQITKIDDLKPLFPIPISSSEPDVIIIHQNSTTSSPPPPPPFTPSKNSSEKRKKLKPTLYEFPSFKTKKKYSPKVELDLSTTNLSYVKKKAATKEFHVPIPDSETMIRAKELQSTLGNDHPSFIKTMVKSHVTICFWMGIPGSFCRKFLPKGECLIVAEDENGHQCDLKFLAHKTGFSAGWRRFAVDHNLLEGDVLIFQLVESCKFKIYIVRADVSKQIDGVLQLINQDNQTEHITPDATVMTCSKLLGSKPTDSTPSSHPLTKVKRKYIRSKPPTLKGIKHKSSSSSSIPLTMVKRKYNRSKPQTPLSSHQMDHVVVNPEVQEGSGLVSDSVLGSGSLKPIISSEEVQMFKDFHIMVDNRCIDSELSEEIRMNYYKLCNTKNEILHANVHEGLYYKLVAGVIGETVSIANALKNCKLTTRKEDFQVWDSSLKSFELIGMKVGFLRDRIRELIIFTFESEDAKRYMEAKEERNRNAYTIKDLEGKLVELKESNRKLDVVIGSLKEKADMSEINFQEMVDAPW